MSTSTISKAKVNSKAGTVTMPLREYRELLASRVPTYYLKGRAAIALDKLVDTGLMDYNAGKAIKADSISLALKEYHRKNGC